MGRERASWLALLAPLPADAIPRRKPVAEPGSPQAASDSPIHGWESLLLDLSDPPFGTRIVMVTLDADGRAISASDHVMVRHVSGADADASVPVHMTQHSVGGRIEPDGTLRGTHWTVEGPEPEGDEAPQWSQVPRPPSADERARLLQLVRDLLSRLAR